jgi:hypothetical protein
MNQPTNPTQETKPSEQPAVINQVPEKKEVISPESASYDTLLEKVKEGNVSPISLPYHNNKTFEKPSGSIFIRIEPVEKLLFFSKTQTSAPQIPLALTPYSDFNGKVKPFLLPEERSWLAENFQKPLDDAFFENYSVSIPPTGTTLDLANYEDFLKYKIILQHNNPSGPLGRLIALQESEKNAPYTLYYVYQAELVQRQKTKQLEHKFTAVKLFNTLAPSEKRQLAIILDNGMVDSSDEAIDLFLMTKIDSAKITQGRAGAEQFIWLSQRPNLRLREAVAKGFAKRYLFYVAGSRIAAGDAENIIAENEEELLTKLATENGKKLLESIKTITG